MRQPPLVVFISHSSEMRRFPAGHSFVDAAISGVIRSGNVPREMEYFSARDQKPADYCREQVSSSMVYIGVLGFRYGSRVADEPDLSYTELEFDAAGVAGIPRLVFLLDQHAPIPVEMVDANRERQEAFRAKAMRSSITINYFTTPAELELAVYQTLTELDTSSSPAKPPWMVPAPWREIVPRPELEAQLTSILISDESVNIGLTTALQGAGGFGKTTLAAKVGREAALRNRFPDGLLWVTIGEHTKGASLAAKINDLAEVVSGHRPTLSDPEQAGYHLGEILGEKMCLIVIDDIWERGQLRPFLQNAPSCTRLITTRNHTVIPADGISIEVDAMENSEARALLAQGLEHFPQMQQNSLLRLTGRWPVLLALVNSYVKRVVAGGLSVEQAAERVGRRLLSAGPVALDVSRPHQRDEAVSATIEASLSLVSNDHLARYEELAIFPEDILIPLDVLSLLWGRADISVPADAEQLCEEFADLSLVQSLQLNPPGIRMHDVVRTYLRSRCGTERLVQMNKELLKAAEAHMPPESTQTSSQWWNLAGDMPYLWSNLSYHLSEAKLADELARLVCDLRWICAKIDRLGPVETEADLARVDQPIAAELRRAIGRGSHLLTEITADVSLRDTVLSRLDGVAELEEVTQAFLRQEEKPWLRPARSLPDRPHYALRRILAGHLGRLLACAAMPDGHSIVGGGEDSHLRVWDVGSGQARLVMEGHDGPIFSCAASADGTWLISGSDDHTIRVWDAVTGECRALLRHHRGPVRTCQISPDGSWLASAGDDLTVQIWDRETAKVRLVMTGHTGVIRTLTVSPDGLWLASAGDDLSVRIWDTRTGAIRRTLTGHSASVWTAMAGPDGAWLATAGLDRTVRIWDPETGSLLRRLDTPSGPVLAYGDSPRGKWLATGGDEGTIQIWDLDSGELRGSLEGHSGRVRASTADPGGHWLATGGDDQSVRTWDVWAVSAESAQEEPTGPTWAVAAATFGQSTAAAAADGKLRLWQHAEGQLKTLTELPVPLWTVALDPEGTRVAAGGQDGRVWVLDVASECIMASIKAHLGAVWACSFTSEGGRLVTAGDDRAVRFWEPASGGRMISEYTGHRAPVRCCALGPSGSWCVTGSDDGEVRLWDISSQRAQVIQASHAGRVWACTVSPDGGWFATGGEDGTLQVHDASTGETRAVFKDHAKRVRGCASNADGTLLASVSADQTIRIWDVSQAQCISAVRVALPLSDCCWSSSRGSVLAVGDSGIYEFHFAR